MAIGQSYIDKDMNGQQLINFRIEDRSGSGDPTGGDLTIGRAWYNSQVIKYYDGAAVQTLATVGQLAALGSYAGSFDASGGAAPTARTVADVDGSTTINAGDYFRVSVAGTLTGLLGGDVVVEPGDILFANVDGANANNQYFAVQTNIDLASVLSHNEVALATLPANTPTVIAHGYTTEVAAATVLDSTDLEIDVFKVISGTTVTITSNVALANLKIKVIGKSV